MSADLIGRTVSRYRVVELLAIGGMGVVYRGEDLRLQRPVALKFISTSLAEDPVARKQFEREARNASSLNHPNICTIYEIDDWEGQPFIAMELLSGSTLKEQLTRQTFDAATTVALAIDIARALEAAHKKDILHRDVKPANIFITGDGTAKLLDFGLATRMPLGEISAQSGGFTDAGRLLGTANYMSPERLRARHVDQRSDLFSLGAVLYEIVAGRCAFLGESVVESIDAILHDDPKPLDECLSPQPRALIQTIARLLQKGPDDRYASATALLAALNALRQDMSSGRAPLFGGVSDWPLTRASIAVLPFRNLDPQPGYEYLGDSLAEELIVALTKVDGLKVALRSSAFTFKTWNAELRDIGARLKVEAVLFGTILQSGTRLRVVCRLSRVADGEQIWSERYDREMTKAADLFALQDEITRVIVERLKVALADRIEPMRRYTQNRDSYLEYMNARFQWANRYEGGLLKALNAFKGAIESDDRNALAYSGLADVFSFLGLYSIRMSPTRAFEQAIAAARAALAIDEGLPEVHTSLGIIALAKWEWRTAEAEFLRATHLDRRQALAEMYYAWLLALTNRRDEARDAIDRAQSIDPLGALVNSGAAWLHFLLRDYAKAIKECEQVEKREPNFLVQLYVKAMALMRHKERRYDQALPLIERAAALADRAPFYLGLLGQIYAETGRRSDVDKILSELDQLRAANVYVPPHCYVYIHASLGDRDRAFAWQEQACEDGAPPFYFMSPAIESLHDDPRHQAHVARMQQLAERRLASAALGSPPRSVNT